MVLVFALGILQYGVSQAHEENENEAVCTRGVCFCASVMVLVVPLSATRNGERSASLARQRSHVYESGRGG